MTVQASQARIIPCVCVKYPQACLLVKTPISGEVPVLLSVRRRGNFLKKVQGCRSSRGGYRCCHLEAGGLTERGGRRGGKRQHVALIREVGCSPAKTGEVGPGRWRECGTVCLESEEELAQFVPGRGIGDDTVCA